MHFLRDYVSMNLINSCRIKCTRAAVTNTLSIFKIETKCLSCLKMKHKMKN